MLEGLGVDQIEVYWNTNIDITKLVGGVSCSYDAPLLVVEVMLFQNLIGKSDQRIIYANRILDRIE
jgi:hypothetical protein